MLSAEQIYSNWKEFINTIDEYIEEPRTLQLINFYKKYEDRLMLMPASHRKEYHNAFPGGYIDHVLRVVDCSLDLYKLWENHLANVSNFTVEELVFSAINHDLGKIGDEYHAAYIEQDDNWRREKLGEDYKFNSKLAFASVPDRGLYLLQAHGIKYSFNEMIAIQTHDGLYDEGNKKYLVSFIPENKPRTCLPYILHQADLMASRIEFEKYWLNLNKEIKPTIEKSSMNIKNKALKNIKSENLKNILDKI